MTCSREGLVNIKLKRLCFPSSCITEQNLTWYVEKLSWEFIPIVIALFPFPDFLPLPFQFPFPRYSQYHSHSHRNPTGPIMGSQLFPFPCTSLDCICLPGDIFVVKLRHSVFGVDVLSGRWSYENWCPSWTATTNDRWSYENWCPSWATTTNDRRSYENWCPSWATTTNDRRSYENWCPS